MAIRKLVERLGRKDLCPCGSGRRFQELLPAFRGILMVPTGATSFRSKDIEGRSEPDASLISRGTVIASQLALEIACKRGRQQRAGKKFGYEH